jgi:hypothetical protein
MRQDEREKAEIELEHSKEAWLSWSAEWTRSIVYTLRRLIIERTIADSSGNY